MRKIGRGNRKWADWVSKYSFSMLKEKKIKKRAKIKACITNREGHKNQWAIDNGLYMTLFFKEKNEEKKLGKLGNNNSLVKFVIDEM